MIIRPYMISRSSTVYLYSDYWVLESRLYDQMIMNLMKIIWCHAVCSPGWGCSFPIHWYKATAWVDAALYLYCSRTDYWVLESRLRLEEQSCSASDHWWWSILINVYDKVHNVNRVNPPNWSIVLDVQCLFFQLERWTARMVDRKCIVPLHSWCYGCRKISFSTSEYETYHWHTR